MPEPFEPLRETLLRAGVAPAHVRRYVRELSEHFSDLVGEELKAGRSLAEARAAARARLGADETLAGAMLAGPAFRSWTGRAPWATLLIGPIVLLVLAYALPIVSLALLVGPAPDGAAPLPPAWLPTAGGAVLDFVQIAGPLLIGSGIALLGARQRSHMIWPLLGCVCVAFFGAGLFWGAHWPVPNARWWNIGVGFQWSHSLAMGSLSLAIAVAVYWTARGRTLAAA